MRPVLWAVLSRRDRRDWVKKRWRVDAQNVVERLIAIQGFAYVVMM